MQHQNLTKSLTSKVVFKLLFCNQAFCKTDIKNLGALFRILPEYKFVLLIGGQKNYRWVNYTLAKRCKSGYWRIQKWKTGLSSFQLCFHIILGKIQVLRKLVLSKAVFFVPSHSKRKSLILSGLLRGECIKRIRERLVLVAFFIGMF
jgi:hypothetical protein